MSTQSDIEILCKNIRFLRHKHSLSQEEMSQLLGVELHSLQLLEQDILPDDIYVDFLWDLSDLFDLSPAQLFKPLW